jgi:hypothetical protein
MIQTILLTAVLFLAMLLPYLPGRFDGSAAMLSFVIQLASYATLVFVPVGVVWLIGHRWSNVCQTLTLALAWLIVVLAAFAAASVNHLTFGVMLAVVGSLFLRNAHRRARASAEASHAPRQLIPLSLTIVPGVLVAFITFVLPRAAEWSRDRAIRHSATLIAAIDSYHQRRGNYPSSLQSLNGDVPTGVIGIERFHYEPNGEAYNLFFVRISIELDSKEVVMFNPRNEHRFASHELDLLEYDGDQLALRLGDRRRTPLTNPHWVSIHFD